MARRAGLGDPIGHLYWGHVHSCGGRELPQAHEGAILFYFFPIGKVSNFFLLTCYRKIFVFLTLNSYLIKIIFSDESNHVCLVS